MDNRTLIESILILCIAEYAVMIIGYDNVEAVHDHSRDKRASNDDIVEHWTPPDNWTRCEAHGLQGISCNQHDRIKAKVTLLNLKQHINYSNTSMPRMSHDIPFDGSLTDGKNECFLLTEEQIDYLLSANQSPERRRKRQSIDFQSKPFFKWTSMPIIYKFDGFHNEYERRLIRSAFQHVSDHTCIQFQEIATNVFEPGHHILLTREPFGCYSFVGKVNLFPQQLNLDFNCLYEFGVPVHEILHALGLFHQQQRNDRNSYVDIHWENIISFGVGYINVHTLDYGPYDYTSVMHYASKQSSYPIRETMTAKNPLYNQAMGQRIGLSFLDAKTINEAYCNDSCRFVQLSRACENEGYQDPLNCHKCRCPDGFTGDFCYYISGHDSANCGRSVIYLDGITKFIHSPGFLSNENYKPLQHCTWLIKAPENHRVALLFKDKFGVYCHNLGQCYHYIEVRYKWNLGMIGPRFCCYDTPSTILRSESNEMMILFRSGFMIDVQSAARNIGFKVAIWPETWDNPLMNPPEYVEPASKSSSTIETTTSSSSTTSPSTTKTTIGFKTSTAASTTKTEYKTSTISSSTPLSSVTASTKYKTSTITLQSLFTTPTTKIFKTVPPTTFTHPVTPTTTTAPAPEENSATISMGLCDKMDISIVLDSSRNLGSESNWNHLLYFTKKLVSEIPIGINHTQVSLISYGNEASVDSTLREHNNIDTLTNVINTLAWKNEQANLWDAVRRLHTQVYSIFNGGRQGVPKVSLVLADGNANREFGDALEQARRARNYGIEMYVIAVGRDINLQELQGMTGSISRVLLVGDYYELQTETSVERVLDSICAPQVISDDFEWSCDFELGNHEGENDWCNMRQDEHDDFNWSRQTGSSPSAETGPSSSKDGLYYLYTECSHPRTSGQYAIIRVPKLFRSGIHCLRFFYNMYGYHTGRLEVFIQTQTITIYPWRLAGEQSKKSHWYEAQVKIRLQHSDEIGFIGSCGGGFSGDIGLDVINVRSGNC